jgi:integrase
VDSIDGKIAQANGRLKSANVGVSIERSGNRLSLRAVLPARPDRGVKAHQQRIALSGLGIRANLVGIKLAEQEARKIGALVACGEFDWSPYDKHPAPENPTIMDWVIKFEADYFQRKPRTSKTETTWKYDYCKIFSKLNPNSALTEDGLRSVILSTEPDTRTRRRAVMVLSALAKFAGLNVDFKRLSGSYTPKSVSPRELPDDYLISSCYQNLSDRSWRWAYGMLATYGLRNHELFHLDFSQMPILLIRESKTGSRRVWPLYPEWVNDWNLSNISIPLCTGKTNTDLGNRVTHAFKRLGIPFRPYDLRHAWAVRSIEFGLDISLAAAQMGHSVQVHTDVYHHWISQDVHQRAFDALLSRSDRPRPPS